MRTAALVVLALSLSVSPSVARFKLFASPAERDDQYCRSLGAVRGSQAYIQCRLARDGQRQQIIGTINQNNQQQMWRNQQILQQLVQPPHIYNCTTSYWGNMAHTTCY